ncbi:3-oxoadipate enol-lactonase [Lentibacillus sp. JNUCC-1]|uniref:alpha/beta fold hydrolase n=1 Tax=Lentibacillus sp. JNUCC-1 TaxID=2654513 RepID=UPI0013253507|nr:3-oxoadipate enol-lactonase [Lentibacillus sp. JNUCC-1]
MGNVKLKKVELSNGETLAYRERDGGDDVVLLIHGNMTSSVHWDVVFEHMPENYKLYAVDLRGFGESSYHKQITSIKDFSDDVKQFVDVVGLKQFALVGWSLGGAVSQQFCADYPGYCDRLFLLASASSRVMRITGQAQMACQMCMIVWQHWMRCFTMTSGIWSRKRTIPTIMRF